MQGKSEGIGREGLEDGMDLIMYFVKTMSKKKEQGKN